MKHEIIQTENYLLVVGDDEINVGNYCLNIEDKEIILSKGKMLNNTFIKKIIAHLPLNPLSSFTYLSGVDVLPEIEDEVEKLSEVYSSEYMQIAFRNGYNKHAETYKYTEEDLSRAIALYLENKSFSEIIKSLNHPKLPVAFECEMFSSDDIKSVEKDWYKIGESKTITTLRGIEWVGTYKF